MVSDFPSQLTSSGTRSLYLPPNRTPSRKVSLLMFPSNCDRDQPFARISASFNINNFLLSRPYPSIPFLTSSLSPSAAPQSTLAHLLSLEITHRISQLDSLGLIPSRVRRLLGGERVPAEIVFVPRLGWKDLLILGKYLLGIRGDIIHQWTVAQGSEGYFDAAAREDLGAGWEEWIFRGEKGVWEVGGYIRAKCAVEITLDHCTFPHCRRLI